MGNSKESGDFNKDDLLEFTAKNSAVIRQVYRAHRDLPDYADTLPYWLSFALALYAGTAMPCPCAGQSSNTGKKHPLQALSGGLSVPSAAPALLRPRQSIG
jgi:hypothetical protein